MWRTVQLFIFAFFIIIPLSAGAESGQVNLTKGELCQNGVTSLVKENVQKLKQEDTLIIFTLPDDAHYVKFAIKSESLPVVFETISDKDLTRFIIRLK